MSGHLGIKMVEYYLHMAGEVEGESLRLAKGIKSTYKKPTIPQEQRVSCHYIPPLEDVFQK